jgi:hypothetical protein
MAIKSSSWQTITEAPPKKAITPGKRLKSSNEITGQLTSEASLGPPRWVAGWVGSLGLAAG